MRVASMRTRRAVPCRSWRLAAAANSSRIQAMVARTVRWSVASAFNPEVALPAVSGIKPLHHRTHEGEVADVQLALPCGAWLGQAGGRMVDKAVRDGNLGPLPCLRRPFTRLPLARGHGVAAHGSMTLTPAAS